MKCRNIDEPIRARATKGGSPFSQESGDYPIIAHSHLDWDWVWQRPQQFLSRLSKRHQVLYVEGPKPVEGVSSSSICVREVADYPNLLVVQTTIPAARWSHGEWVDGERRRLLQTLLAEPIGRNFVSPVQWFYDPMAVSAFAGEMNESAIVYDCMDQLSQFRFCPPELVKREQELLAAADVVFAGGPKIWQEKSKYNPNCFMYGCGVDTLHFGAARSKRHSVPHDISELPHPIYGYIGVVDERLDYELLASLADSNSEGSVVMVGPTAKVDPALFPKRDNLHWLGGRDYSLLPGYAKAFDVCLMPFALNEATQFINPTKALEYMATETPIVSTPIEDVVSQFNDIVLICKTPAEFSAACARAAFMPNKSALQRGLQRARTSSWDAVVRNLEGHIEYALSISEVVTASAA